MMIEFSTQWPGFFCPKCRSRYQPKLEYRAAFKGNVIFISPCCEFFQEDHLHARCINCDYEAPMKTADAENDS